MNLSEDYKIKLICTDVLRTVPEGSSLGTYVKVEEVIIK